MGERTEYTPGTFSWVELLTSDADGAKAFYGEVLGWEYDDAPLPEGGTYTLVLKDGKRVAGLHQPSPENAGPPAWLSYVAVEDADAAAAKAGELGASVLAGPFDVMDVGRMAVLQDPQGAVFAVWQAGRTAGAELVNDPGSLTMNQLNAADVDGGRELLHKALRMAVRAGVGGSALLGHLQRRRPERRAHAAPAGRRSAPALARLLHDLRPGWRRGADTRSRRLGDRRAHAGTRRAVPRGV